MTKLTAPLQSLRASGSIGKLLSFDNRSGQRRVRKMPQPSDPKTLLQIYHRWDYQYYSQKWRDLTSSDKQLWETNARRLRITGFNYWMRTMLTTLPDLAGRWHLDEPAGNIAFDSSKNANNGTIVGASTVPGFFDRALFFDDLDDLIDFGNPSYYRLQQFTIELWFKGIPLKDTGLAYDYDYNYPSYILGFWPQDSTVKLFSGIYVEGPSWKSLAGDTAFDPTIWHHGALSYDQQNLRLYLDGIPDGVRAETGDIIYDPTKKLYLGWCDGYDYGGGTFDEPNLFNEALSPALIKLHSERRYP